MASYKELRQMVCIKLGEDDSLEMVRELGYIRNEMIRYGRQK